MKILINRIVSLQELATFVPSLVKLHESLEGRWEPDMSTEDFLSKLIQFFDPHKTYYFGQLAENGDLIYFVALLPEEKTTATFWLFYMNKDYRTETYKLLFELRQWAIEKGFTTVYSQSTRTEKSYERWLSKFGAEKVATVYKFNLI